MIDLQDQILTVSGASSVLKTEPVQTLWSGYGEIRRYHLSGGKHLSVIVKHILWPKSFNHPHGWNSERSHQRKLQSYQVERCWYERYAQHTAYACKVPSILKTVSNETEIMLIMEDLDAAGYVLRLNPDSVSLADAKRVLTWLAHFHAKFMCSPYEGLWPVGTYWHLDTRPDEWSRMKNVRLKEQASAIDERLSKAQYQTIVHGDAKLANFCFSPAGEVSAVDFQYVGKGCGMKDVAYFISSCFEDDQCESDEKELLNHYFDQLKMVLDKSIDFQSVKTEWLTLYKYAWADFYRFLDGWSPGHWKMHSYSRKITNEVLEELENG